MNQPTPSMSELTDRLRRHAERAPNKGYALLFAAADRIDELEAWKAEAAKALTHWDHVAEPVVKGNAKHLGWFKWDAVAVELNRQEARIAELEAALHIPQSCTTVQDLVDHLGERQAYAKIVADSIGHRGRIAELETALREIERSGPLTVCHEVARQALGDNDE